MIYDFVYIYHEEGGSLHLLAVATLALTVALALCAEVVAKHGTQDEVFLGGELVERTVDDETDGIETLATTKIEVEGVLACGLKNVGDVLMLQALGGILLVTLVHGEQHHLANTFLVFVDVIHQHLHVYRHSIH